MAETNAATPAWTSGQFDFVGLGPFQAEQLHLTNNPASEIVQRISSLMIHRFTNGAFDVLKVMTGGGELIAYPGDWIVVMGSRKLVFSDAEFKTLFAPHIEAPTFANQYRADYVQPGSEAQQQPGQKPEYVFTVKGKGSTPIEYTPPISAGGGLPPATAAGYNEDFEAASANILNRTFNTPGGAVSDAALGSPPPVQADAEREQGSDSEVIITGEADAKDLGGPTQGHSEEQPKPE